MVLCAQHENTEVLHSASVINTVRCLSNASLNEGVMIGLSLYVCMYVYVCIRYITHEAHINTSNKTRNRVTDRQSNK